jgi:hypothetical protein
VTLAQLLAEHRHVLLDFDGPVCAVFGDVSARDGAARLAAALRSLGIALPAGIVDTDDPFDILRAAAEAHAASMAEAMLRDLELQAVRVAPLTPGIRDALDALAVRGTRSRSSATTRRPPSTPSSQRTASPRGSPPSSPARSRIRRC